MRDLSDSSAWITRILYRIDRLEGGAMLENSSITNGRMRFIGGLLRVDSGGRVEIVGTLQVDGESTVTGTFNVEGPWNLSGDGTITGEVTISGPVTISGDVDLTGTMTVTGDIEVSGSGRVKVGNMTLDPSSSGGKLKFSGGPEVYATGGMLGLYSTGSGGWIEIDGAGVRLNHGVRSVEVNSTGVKVVGIPTKAGTGLLAGLLWSDPSGNVYRIVS